MGDCISGDSGGTISGFVGELIRGNTMKKLLWVVVLILSLVSICDAVVLPLRNTHRSGAYEILLTFPNGYKDYFLIDTGATMSHISDKTFAGITKQSGASSITYTREGKARLADNSLINTKIWTLQNASLTDELKVSDLEVTVGEGDNLLGMNFLSKLESWSIDPAKNVLIVGRQDIERQQHVGIKPPVHVKVPMRKGPIKVSHEGFSIELSCKKDLKDNIFGKSLFTLKKNGKIIDSHMLETSCRYAEIGFLDILGKGDKQLVFYDYTGGAHCCSYLAIYSFNNGTINKIFDGESEPAFFVFSGSSEKYIIQDDRTLSYFRGACSACSVGSALYYSYDEQVGKFIIRNVELPSYILRNIKELENKALWSYTYSLRRAKFTPGEDDGNAEGFSDLLNVFAVYLSAGERSKAKNFLIELNKRYPTDTYYLTQLWKEVLQTWELSPYARFIIQK